MSKEIRFYSSSAAYFEFSNYYMRKMYIGGHIWPSVEHYYQAQKTLDIEIRSEIKGLSRPSLAKGAGQASPVGLVDLRPGWSGIRLGVMRRACYSKFTQHSDLLKLLLDTEDSVLIENSPTDFFWGCGRDDSGANNLGKVLMEVRESLKNTHYE